MGETACFVTGPRSRGLAESASAHVYDLSSDAFAATDLDGLQQDAVLDDALRASSQLLVVLEPPAGTQSSLGVQCV
eukprot:COSAG02_NODE_7112_length_3178_cov_6.480351_5_plen_76_part_00